MIINNDCLMALKELPENSVDAIITDPPYHLVSVTKRFGGKNAHNTPAMETKEGGVFARKAKGFMGKEWDGVDENGIGIAQKVELWEECLRVLKPGGYLLAFSGTRTYHRMAVAIEDAGFEVRDMIAWIYGSGFPKSLNIGKAVDKLQGNEREVVGEQKLMGTARRMKGGNFNDFGGEDTADIVNLTKGTSEWEGWGTALKPAVEPISVCQKPLQVEHIFAILINDIWKHLPATDATYNLRDTQAKLNEVVNSVPENARINFLEKIDSVGLAELYTMLAKTNLTEEKANSVQESVRQADSKITQENSTQTGEVGDVCLMNISISAQMGDISENTVLLWKDISEELLNQANKLTILMAIKQITELRTLRSCLQQNIGTNTSLSKEIQPNLEPICMARKPLAEKTVAENCLKYGTGGINIDESRVGTDEEIGRDNRNIKNSPLAPKDGWNENSMKGLDTRGQFTGRFPANLIHDGSDEVLGLFPQTKGATSRTDGKGVGMFASGNKEAGVIYPDSGSAARFFYCAKASKSERNKGCEGLEERQVFGDEGGTYQGLSNSKHKSTNFHPTVKPIALMEYLVKLVSKEGHTVLDPFLGSGTTAIACKNLNRNCIGIERDAEYVKISEARISAVK